MLLIPSSASVPIAYNAMASKGPKFGYVLGVFGKMAPLLSMETRISKSSSSLLFFLATISIQLFKNFERETFFRSLILSAARRTFLIRLLAFRRADTLGLSSEKWFSFDFKYSAVLWLMKMLGIVISVDSSSDTDIMSVQSLVEYKSATITPIAPKFWTRLILLAKLQVPLLTRTTFPLILSAFWISVQASSGFATTRASLCIV
mmetsp:Transcript_6408/g.9602  ORF Transcript_6408/g.9602 Transcript_6408/m.9602 type:complete len:204 (+) Transcript_6408:515-1126(+)